MGRVVKIKNLEIGQGRPKICGLVMGEKAEDVLELAEKSKNVNCDLFEFRADFFEDVLEIEKTKSLVRKIRRIVKKPMIFTFRRFEEGGKVKTTLKYYKELLTMIAENNLAEIIDVECSAIERADKLVPYLKECGAFVIMSRHDFNSTPSQEEIFNTFFEMQTKGADIIKVAYMPNSKKDVLNLINATEEMTTNHVCCPIVAISMGHLGMITRILGEFMDSAITFASITRSSAPGQINIENLNTVLNVIHNNFKRVFLIGFMGTGKTAVANALATKYGLSKIDLDAFIEQREHQSIADIFYNQSEEVFRDKETKYLRRIIQKDFQVVSLGGGVLIREENVKMIKEKGDIILLTAKPETIIERIKNDKTRPLIGDNMDLDYIRDLMKQREKSYLSLADMIISTDEKSLDEICKEIVDNLGFTA